MRLSSKQNDYRNYSNIALMLYHLQNVKFTEQSFNRFGDKNNLTKGLKTLYIDSKKGQSIDKFVKDSLSDDFSNLDEKQKIELAIETMIKFDNKGEIDRYFKSIEEQKTKAVKKAPVNINEVKPCLVKASLEKMSRTELRQELKSLMASPRSYFGKLLEVDQCKTDLFTVTEKEQVKIAIAMLNQLDYEEEKTKQIKFSPVGTQKPLNLGYGDTLQVQKGYSNLKSQNTNMATKKKTTKATSGKAALKPVSRKVSVKAKSTGTKVKPQKKTSLVPKLVGASAKQRKAQAKIKEVSKIATEIQKQGGTKTLPEQKVFKINRADAVKKAWKML